MAEHIHSKDGDPKCYGCKLKMIAIGLPRDFRTRTYGRVAPATPKNSWEKGIATDERGVPYLIPGTTEPMGMKRFTEERHGIEENKRRAHQGVPLK